MPCRTRALRLIVKRGLLAAATCAVNPHAAASAASVASATAAPTASITSAKAATATTAATKVAATATTPAKAATTTTAATKAAAAAKATAATAAAAKVTAATARRAWCYIHVHLEVTASCLSAIELCSCRLGICCLKLNVGNALELTALTVARQTHIDHSSTLAKHSTQRLACGVLALCSNAVPK